MQTSALQIARALNYLDEPVDENGAHLLIDIRLTRHVVGRHAALDFGLPIEAVNVLNVLHHTQLIARVVFVNVRNGLCLSLVHLRIETPTCRLRYPQLFRSLQRVHY
jgi:hypothetical protein